VSYKSALVTLKLILIEPVSKGVITLSKLLESVYPSYVDY